MPQLFGAAEVVSDRSWSFDVDADTLWERLSDIGRYRSWWPWLREFDPSGGFGPGARWRCAVAPPLPYVVRFVVALDRIDEGRSVTASVTGDVEGHAKVEVEPLPDGTSTAHLLSRLAPANPILKGVARAAGPLVRWGHDWVIDQGCRQFDPQREIPRNP